jgi:hypothetical protein
MPLEGLAGVPDKKTEGQFVSKPMKAMRTVAFFASLAFVIAGCEKQPQQTAPDSAHAVAHAAAPLPPSNPPKTAQKASPVFVFSTTASGPEAASATNASQGEVSEVSIRLDLPQADANVVLQGAARTTLEAALSVASGSAPVLLPDESAAALMDNLPEEFRGSCDAMASGWRSDEKGAGKWTVRVLFSLRRLEGTKAVLAFRCTSDDQGDENSYDERPAIVSLTSANATLKLIPLAPEENGHQTLYRLNLSQAFRAVGTQLVELNVYHTTDNPCCGGGDEESGSRRFIVDLVNEKNVLSMDERTELERDDSSEDALMERICETKFSYLHDGAGSVEGISTETRCTEDKEPLPEVKRQTFHWNAETHEFAEMK